MTADERLGMASPEPVPAELIPRMGTFWSLQRTNAPPLPYNPFPDLPVFYLGRNSFAVDDRQVDYEALREARAMERALRTAEAEYGVMSESTLEPPPGEGWVEADEPSYGPPPGPGLCLRLERSVAGDHGQRPTGLPIWCCMAQCPDEMYELQSRPELDSGLWAGEGTVLGWPDQNWTPMVVVMGSSDQLPVFPCAVVGGQ